MTFLLISENKQRLSEQELDSLSTHLPFSMTEYAKRYRRWEDAQAYLFSKVLLTEGLKRFGIKESVLQKICYTQYNRPYLIGDIDFNISHSGEYVVCALSQQRIGIDIEQLNEIDTAEFSEQFTAGEWFNIRQSENPLREFYRHWTIKEAAIKADGRGMHIPLKDVIITADEVLVQKQRWHYQEMYIDHSYIVHIVSENIIRDTVVTERISLTPYISRSTSSHIV